MSLLGVTFRSVDDSKGSSVTKKYTPALVTTPDFPHSLWAALPKRAPSLPPPPVIVFHRCRLQGGSLGVLELSELPGTCMFWELLKLLSTSSSSSRRGTLQCRGNATSPSRKEQNLPLQVPRAETDPQNTLNGRVIVAQVKSLMQNNLWLENEGLSASEHQPPTKADQQLAAFLSSQLFGKL